MPVSRQLLLALLVASAAPLAAQEASKPQAASPADSAQDLDDEGVRLGLQFGVTTGALAYRDGRSEQALGAVIRWAPVRWFSLSTTPTAVHSSTPPITGTTALTRDGLVDLPVAATLSHHFDARLAPTFTGGLGFTLPVGDSATGFGSGRVGTELEIGAGITPSARTWVSVGAGRSLSSVAAQSAFSSGAGWGDLSAGVSVNDRVSLEGGFDTDLGPVDDPTVGHSRSFSGGFGFQVTGPTMLNVSASHGVSGIAPKWSFAVGIGTAFPVLGHASPAPLRKAFGGSSHTGLPHGRKADLLPNAHS